MGADRHFKYIVNLEKIQNLSVSLGTTKSGMKKVRQPQKSITDSINHRNNIRALQAAHSLLINCPGGEGGFQRFPPCATSPS